MKLNEPTPNFELKNTLSCLRLPINPDNIPLGAKIEELKNRSIYQIKELLKEMKINEHRTTNFATILYIEENNYEKLSMDDLKLKIKKDFNQNKNMFVNSRNNSPFISEKSLIQSMNASISRNKSFITEIIDNKKYVSLNQLKALDYLKKMYSKYTSNFDGDITSMASIDSKKSKMNSFSNNNNGNGNKSEKKRKKSNLIGNKTFRNINLTSYEESILDEEEKKIKILKENLIIQKPSNNLSKGKKENNNISKKKSNISEISEQKNKNLSLFIKDIDNSINALDMTEKIISSYKTKLYDLKTRVTEKERKFQDYENAKTNVNSIKNELNVLYKIMAIKLGIIQSTKKHKYYGDIFSKSKNLSINYKFLFDKKIDIIKNSFSKMNSIKSEILNQNSQISNGIKSINEKDIGSYYLAKNEIKKDVNNLIKKIKNDDKIIDSLTEDDDNNILIEEIRNKFNEIAQEITEEKEDFE